MQKHDCTKLVIMELPIKDNAKAIVEKNKDSVKSRGPIFIGITVIK